MKIGFVFPGQGSQYVGMGKDLYEKSDYVKEIYQNARRSLGVDIIDICFNGPQEVLTESKNAQVAIFLHSYSSYILLKEKGIIPYAVAGHSLGEYTACVASGALSFEDTLHLVRFRGELMSNAGQENPGTMAAIIGLKRDAVEQIVKEVSQNGILIIANYNSPQQIVVSGEKHTIEEAIQKAKEKGAKRAIKIPVSGAFHSPLMENASLPFTKVLSRTEIKDAKIYIIPNIIAKPTKDKQVIREALSKQITHSVMWEESVYEMDKMGIDTFIELGPGKVLTNLIKRTVSGKRLLKFDNYQDFLNIMEVLNEIKG